MEVRKAQRFYGMGRIEAMRYVLNKMNADAKK